MGGSVDVESQPGRLTVFTVRLGVPVAAARETLPA
jgi:signal transduction histidine kinase